MAETRLVSPVDCGSHDDMDASSFECSIASLASYSQIHEVDSWACSPIYGASNRGSACCTPQEASLLTRGDLRLGLLLAAAKDWAVTLQGQPLGRHRPRTWAGTLRVEPEQGIITYRLFAGTTWLELAARR